MVVPFIRKNNPIVSNNFLFRIEINTLICFNNDNMAMSTLGLELETPIDVFGH